MRQCLPTYLKNLNEVTVLEPTPASENTIHRTGALHRPSKKSRTTNPRQNTTSQSAYMRILSQRQKARHFTKWTSINSASTFWNACQGWREAG